ncbi:MAG: hypothetical protein HZB56_14325 [Deltaproteobacteria bacterium]|nr:hypothetical protein [Deltaproteobacteria bacterium]
MALPAALLLLCAAASADPASAALRAGDDAYAKRSAPGRAAEAAERYAEAAAMRPGDASVELRLARARAFLAAAGGPAGPGWLEVMRPAERALRRVSPAFAAAIDQGQDLGEAAQRVERPGAEPLYWLALGTMGLARERGLAALLLTGAPARRAMERAAELDEAVDEAGPRRALGAWLAVLPSAGGGGAERSRAAFARARALAPRSLRGRVAEAETLAVLLQDRALFDRLLGEVLAADPAADPAFAPEHQQAQGRARELLARRDRLF